MYKLVYAEINIICIIVLCIILNNEKKSIDKRFEILIFEKIIIGTITILFCDVIWSFIDGKYSSLGRILNVLVNSTFMFCTALISYYWTVYTHYKMNITISKKQEILFKLPLIVFFILCYTSHFFKTVFYIDTGNYYHRGHLYFIQLLICYSYIFYTFGICVKQYFKSKNNLEKNQTAVLLSFYIFPVIGGILNAFVYGIPLTLPSVTLSILLVYTVFQGHQISTDSLTGLYNRRQFDIYLSQIKSDSNRIFLILADMNNFKKINDNFGHVEGDRALYEAAKLLKKASKDYNVVVARYGGDEFGLIVECDFENDILILEDLIRSAFYEYNNTNHINYNFDICLGHAEYDRSQINPSEAVKIQADKALYREKKTIYSMNNQFD